MCPARHSILGFDQQRIDVVLRDARAAGKMIVVGEKVLGQQLVVPIAYVPWMPLLNDVRDK